MKIEIKNKKCRMRGIKKTNKSLNVFTHLSITNKNVIAVTFGYNKSNTGYAVIKFINGEYITVYKYSYHL